MKLLRAFFAATAFTTAVVADGKLPPVPNHPPIYIPIQPPIPPQTRPPSQSNAKLSFPAVPFERLNKTDALLVVLDLQDGLFGLARDFDPAVYYNAMIAHAAIGKLFDLPVIMSTSAQTGPNGPLPREILEMYPDAPLVERQGEVDAWDNAAFRQAVRETGRKQVIVAGITTDVCK